MNFQKLIKDICETGMKQGDIASFCHTVPGYISDLKVGRSKVPNWIIGDKLIKLHKRKCRKKKS